MGKLDVISDYRYKWLIFFDMRKRLTFLGRTTAAPHFGASKSI